MAARLGDRAGRVRVRVGRLPRWHSSWRRSTSPGCGRRSTREQLADFVALLDPVNASADAADGFVWRLQGDDGNATSIAAFDWDRGDSSGVIVNMSVWRGVDELKAWMYGDMHRAVLRRRNEWFHRVSEATVALWWVAEGHRPTTAEAEERVQPPACARSDRGGVRPPNDRRSGWKGACAGPVVSATMTVAVGELAPLFTLPAVVCPTRRGLASRHQPRRAGRCPGGAGVLPGRPLAGVHGAAPDLQPRHRRLRRRRRPGAGHQPAGRSTSTRGSPPSTAWRFPLLADEGKKVGEAYGILGPLGFYRRSIFVIDAAGVVRYAHRATAGLTFRPVDEIIDALHTLP